MSGWWLFMRLLATAQQIEQRTGTPMQSAVAQIDRLFRIYADDPASTRYFGRPGGPR